MKMPHIYIGTGGYSDTDLLGTLYPYGTPKSEFLSVYSRHYDTIELNSTFHAPIGASALQGMLDKAEDRLQFSIKLHQDFSHKRLDTPEQAKHFLIALQAVKNQGKLANLFVQFPHTFERTQANRLYLANLCAWFKDYPLAIEFRHTSWHTAQVYHTFQQQPNLIWCNVDYPIGIGLPTFHFQSFQAKAYLRLHGHNPNWWEAESAAERHNYRYTNTELQQLAKTLYQHRETFDELYLYFQNTTNSHSFYNIQTLKGYLQTLGFQIKTEIDEVKGEQQSLF